MAKKTSKKKDSGKKGDTGITPRANAARPAGTKSKSAPKTELNNQTATVGEDPQTAKTAISQITGSAFGVAAPSTSELNASQPDISNKPAGLPETSKSATEAPARTAPAFHRLVQDYLSKNPTIETSVVVDDDQLSHDEEEHAADFADAFSSGDDLFAVIEILKIVPAGKQRKALCLKATEEAHKAAKLEGMEIIGVDESRDALIVRDPAQKQILTIDKSNQIVKTQDI